AYSDSLQGANVGAALSDEAALRVRVRHSNGHTGLPGEWDFNGDALVPPLTVGDAQTNTLLGSVELTVAAPSGWQHRFIASDYFYRYTDNSPEGNTYNFVSFYDEHANHTAFEYQGDYSERTWAHSTFGYRIENENALVNYPSYFSETNGQRLDQDAYLQQQFTLGRLSVIAGGRFVHSSTYGNTGVPRVAHPAGTAGRRFFVWNPPAFFLCHGLHGTRFPGDLRQSWFGLRPEPWSIAGAHAGIRNRLPAESAAGPLGPKRNLLQQPLPRSD